MRGFKQVIMDKTDKQILELLQQNCQISNQELAELVSLSPLLACVG